MKYITDPYWADMHKMRGQGVSLKIANTTHPNKVMQLEYALVDGILYYDESGLDCADPAKHSKLYNNRTLTDQNILTQDMQDKIDMCPGLQNGYKLGLKGRQGYDTSFCEPVVCDGLPGTKCSMYYFGRTYTDEPSKTCRGAFRGDMVMDLCAGNMVSAGGR
jgi:hypothetical protein